MLLKGKAKEDFLYWNHHVKQNDWGYLDMEPKSLNIGFSELDENLQYAIIIDWFDSVGVHVAIDPHTGGGADVYYAKVIYRMSNFIDTWVDVENPNIIGEYYFSSRTQATKQAILKANQIYNNK